MKKKNLYSIIAGSCVLLAILLLVAYSYWLAPTRILIVNPLPAQAADIALNNDCGRIKVKCIKMEEVEDLSGYDAIMMYGRGLFLDETQVAELERVAAKGVPVFTNALRHFNFIVNHNTTPEQQAILQKYFQNACRQNYRNALRYLRHISTPQRLGDRSFETPVELPNNLFYHKEYGQYFKTPQELTEYLKEKCLYHEEGRSLTFISGISFPMEGNRAHVDTLISRLTQAGFNVYPITGSGKGREDLIRTLHPDGLVYLPMGRLGNDSLINWLHAENIPCSCLSHWCSPVKNG